MRRLENDDTAQERAKMTYGPDGDDSTKEDKDTPELATLHLYLSAKQTLILTERSANLIVVTAYVAHKLHAKLASVLSVDAKSEGQYIQTSFE